jgi:acetyltransferase
MSENKLEKFFIPKSVAVIGASSKAEKIGCGIMKNLIEGGFKGNLYPVNLKAGKILGLKAYPSVLRIIGPVDLAIVAIPAVAVNAALKECGTKGIKNVIVISAGFKEAGKDGAKLEKEMAEIAAGFDMKIIGPNCLGLADSSSKLNASFANGMISKGSLAFISQSGAICSSMLDWAQSSGVGFSRFVSIGNKVNVSEADLLEYLRGDDKTTAVLAYLESIKDGERFMKAAAELASRKPLVIIKPGTSKASQQAMQSHTGALAGAAETVGIACAQTGTTQVKDMEELFNAANLLSRCTTLKNNRIAIVTNAGGPGVLATDEIDACGLTMAKLSKSTQKALRAQLPAEANLHNPVDVLGDAKEERFRIALDALIADKNVDAIVFILTPQRGTPIAKIAKVLSEIGAKSSKPVVASFIGGKLMAEDVSKLKRGPLAVYDHLGGAIGALGKVWECKQNREEAKQFLLSYRMKSVHAVADDHIVLRKSPDFMAALKLLQSYDIPIVQSELALTSKRAVEAAHTLGYPVAMKIFSPKISHKTEVEGVRIGIKDDLEVQEYFDRMKKKLGGDLDGMVVQPMAEGREIILGFKRDENFGPMLMFGLGGIYTEVVKDVSFRFAPIDRSEALQMMQEIKTYKILTGYREFPKLDVEAVADALVGLSRLAMDHPEIKELDINPLMVDREGRGCQAVDVRMIV